MAFYDQDKYIRGMGRTRENMANIIQNAAKAQVNANNAYGRVISGLSQDVAGIATSMIKNKLEEEKEASKRMALVDALQKAGASKNIIDATANLSSSDILPMVALMTNPKNITTTHHSGGKARIQNAFTGKTEDIGETYTNSKKVNSTYLALNDSRLSMIEKNPELRNVLMNAKIISFDDKGMLRVNDLDALDKEISNNYAKWADGKMNGQKERIEEENKDLNKNIQNHLNNNVDPAAMIIKNASDFDEAMKKKYPLLYGR